MLVVRYLRRCWLLERLSLRGGHAPSLTLSFLGHESWSVAEKGGEGSGGEGRVGMEAQLGQLLV